MPSETPAVLHSLVPSSNNPAASARKPHLLRTRQETKYSRLAHDLCLSGATASFPNRQPRPSFSYSLSHFDDWPALRRPHHGPPEYRGHFRSPQSSPVWRPQLSKSWHSLRLRSLNVLLFLRGAHDHEASIRPRNRTAYKDHIVIGPNLHDAQILHGHAFVTHVTRHSHVLPDSSRRRPVSDRSVSPMHFRTVSGWLARKPMLFYHTLKSLALGSPDHVDELAGIKLADTQIQVAVQHRSIRQPEFPNESLRLRIRLLEMAEQRLRNPRFLLQIKPYLNGRISVTLRILHLQNRVPLSLNHGHRRSFAASVVNTRHAYFAP